MLLAVTYLHLLAVAVAVGVMVLEDATLLISILRAHKQLEDPVDRRQRKLFRVPGSVERGAVTASLMVLYVTGAGLIMLGLEARADYLTNPKLLAKLALVGLLTLNAFVLHHYLFPRIKADPDVLGWALSPRAVLVATVGLSNSLWLYIALLGVARGWSYGAVPFWNVIAAAVALWVAVAAAIALVLRVAGKVGELR